MALKGYGICLHITCTLLTHPLGDGRGGWFKAFLGSCRWDLGQIGVLGDILGGGDIFQVVVELSVLNVVNTNLKQKKIDSDVIVSLLSMVYTPPSSHMFFFCVRAKDFFPCLVGRGWEKSRQLNG